MITGRHVENPWAKMELGFNSDVAQLPLKRAPKFPRSQRMASVALNYRRHQLSSTIFFTRAMFRPRWRERKLELFCSHQKSPRCSSGGGEREQGEQRYRGNATISRKEIIGDQRRAKESNCFVVKARVTRRGIPTTGTCLSS